MTETLEKKDNKFLIFYKDNELYINCVLLSILFFLNLFFTWGTFVVYPILLVLVVFSNIKNSITYLFFSFVFFNLYLPYSAVAYAICVFAMIIKFIIVKIKENKNNFKLSLPSIILFSIFIIYLFLPINKIYNPILFLNAFVIIFLIALLFLVFKFPEEFRVGFNFNILMVSIILASLFSFFIPLTTHFKGAIETHTIYSIRRFSALFINPNTLAIVCEFGVSIMLYYIIKNKMKLLDMITFFAFFIVGIFTLSKTFMVIVGFNFIVLVVYSIQAKSKNTWKILLSLIGVFAFVMFVNANIVFSYFNRFIEPIDTSINTGADAGEVINHLTTNRFDLWLLYLTDLFKNPVSIIFGLGLSSPIIGTLGPHNMYVSMLYQFGIIGTCLLIATLVFVIKDAIKGKVNISYAYFIPLISVMMLAFVEDLVLFIH